MESEFIRATIRLEVRKRTDYPIYLAAHFWKSWFRGKVGGIDEKLHQAHLAILEKEIQQAITSGDANFFRRFAKFLEPHKGKKPLKDPFEEWLVWKHQPTSRNMLPRFTKGQLVKEAIEKGLVRSDKENTRKKIRDGMKKFGFVFKGSNRGTTSKNI